VVYKKQVDQHSEKGQKHRFARLEPSLDFNVKSDHLRLPPHSIPKIGMNWIRLPLLGGERSSLWVYTSAAVVGLAGVFQLRFGAVEYFSTKTHCYQSVRTHSELEPYVNCFSVSPSGTFSKVFQAEPQSSLAKKADPGYAIPGLWDGHGHLLQYGEFLNSVDLFGSESIEDILSRVKSYLGDHPDAGSKDEWVRGTGWDQMAFGRMPTAVGAYNVLSGGMLTLTSRRMIWLTMNN
jgi:hypothetical protein